MKKRNRKFMLSLGSIISISSVAVGIISCGTNPNAGFQPNGPYAYTIYYKDGTSKSVTYEVFMAYLRNHPGANTSQQIQYDNQVIKWLYQDEYSTNVTAHDSDSTITALTSYKDIYKNAKKKLDDAKKDTKNQNGTNWEAQWQKELLSSQYGESFSEDQAVEYLAVQSMKSDALKRFTLKIDTSTYKYDDIDDHDYPFLVGKDTNHNKNAISDTDSKKAIALITSSYDNDYKSPDNLLKGYMERYQSTYNVRHILYAIKAGAKPIDPWTLTTDSIKKLYNKLPNTNDITYKKLDTLGSNPASGVTPSDVDNWGIGKDPANSLINKILANGNSDNAATTKTYGSLGMSSMYDNIKNLVPGFALPLAVNNNNGAANVPSIPNITPKSIDFDMDSALIAGDSSNKTWSKTSLPSNDKNIANDINIILGDVNNLKKTMSNLKSQFATDGTRKLEYSLNNSTLKTPKTMGVFSSDGFHMIYKQQINNDTTKLQRGLNPWTVNDLNATKNGDPLVYNVSKEINSKMSPSNNFTHIYDVVSNEKKPNTSPSSYPNPMKFDDFVKTQKDYANDNDTNFSASNIKLAKDNAKYLNDIAQDSDILSIQKKYNTWWDSNVGSGLIDPLGLTYINMSNLIYVLGKVGE